MECFVEKSIHSRSERGETGGLMESLKEKHARQIPALRKEAHELIEAGGSKVVSQVTVSQVFGGMRGVIGLVCDTSLVEPDQGLIIRGIPISQLADRLPEEVFFLLLTGQLPDSEELKAFQDDLRERAQVPGYIWDVLAALPADSHPMTMFSTAILALERDSVFRRRYAEGMHKDEFWEAALEDSLQLLAKLPAIAAGIYRLHTGKGARIPSRPELDWGADFAQMLGLPDPDGGFARLMRLYLTLHSDHEGGNVSAFTCHTVGSALSSPMLAVSAGMNGLAGPLHGLANQECLHFVLEIEDKFGGAPTDAQLSEFVWNKLREGSVVPGYGHAVLRVTDPRFTAFHAFGERSCSSDEVFKIVDRLYALTPGLLKAHGHAKDPWPNVDAISGALLYHFGLKEFDYYTVLFGVSRAMGMTAQLVISRALGAPIIRPKSVTTAQIRDLAGVLAHAA
jgi:citrate synthase